MLLVGASGQLGSDVAARAGPPDWELVDIGGRLDLSEPDAVAGALEGVDFDLLVNCAADNDTAAAEDAADRPFRVNAHAVEQLARAARERDARFLHVSTDYVFDGRLGRPYRETDPPAPLSVYGASKLVGEALARTAHPRGTIVVRTASLFGVAGRDPGRGNFVETIIMSAAERDRLQVVDDVTMSPTYTADLAGALLALLAGEAPAGTYHVANEGRATWYELAAAVVDELGLDVVVEPVESGVYPSPLRRPRFSVLDASRAAGYTGRLPHWRDALSRYLAARARARPDSPVTE